MNKKVMALAVAGALAAPAAALAQVQIGGSLTILYYSHDPDNNSVGQKGDILESSEPEFYIRASEKLGGGMSAWFQCSSSMDGFIGGAAAAAGTCARNSGFGFQGGFGNLFLGNWDTPLKLVQNSARGWFSGTNPLAGGGFALLAAGAASGATNTGASFYRRQANSVNYHSPNLGGFSFNAAYSANNESTGIPDSSSSTPRLLGASGRFATGPFSIALGYEKHDDYTVVGGTDDNVTIVAGIKIAGLNARAAYSKSEYDVTTTTNLEATGWALYADYDLPGPHTVRAAYISLDDIEGNAVAGVAPYAAPGVNTGATVTTLAYSYAMSKRTELSFAYNQMKNDSAATFSQGKVAASAGGKQKSIGLLVKHRF